LSGTGEPSEVRGRASHTASSKSCRVSPQLGRTFTAEEDRPEQDAVVILGTTCGKELRRRIRTFVGQKILSVTAANSRRRDAARFQISRHLGTWVPLALTPQMFTRTDHGLNSVARLKDGVTIRGGAG
jgi:hypothetical protein